MSHLLCFFWVNYLRSLRCGCAAVLFFMASVGNKTTSRKDRPIRRYLCVLQALQVLTSAQISALFKTSDDSFLNFFINLSYNITVAGNIPVASGRCKIELKRDFGKQLLRLASTTPKLSQKRDIFVKHPELAKKLAKCATVYANKEANNN